MYYVEMLRALRTLRVFAYVLGAMVLFSVAARFFVGPDHGYNGPAPAAGVRPVTVSQPDGSTVETYRDVKGANVTIVRHPNGEYAVTRVKGSGANRRVTHLGGDSDISLNVLMIIASCAAALVGSILGLALARENDGHLELAWTKPASRVRYAATAIGIDILAMWIAGATFVLAAFAVMAISASPHRYYATPDSAADVLFCLLFPVAIYGVTMGATASLRRGSTFLALFWPGALLLPLLTSVEWMNIGTAARYLDTLNPVVYFYAFCGTAQQAAFWLVVPPQPAIETLCIALLGAIGLAASLAQWRRLEA